MTVEFDDEGYPPGSLGYEIRRMRAEAAELGDPGVIATVGAAERHIADLRDDALERIFAGLDVDPELRHLPGPWHWVGVGQALGLLDAGVMSVRPPGGAR